MLPFSATNEAPAYVKDPLISPKNKTEQKILGQFVNKTRNFSHPKILIDFIVVVCSFFRFTTIINSQMCIEQPHSILQQNKNSKQFVKNKDSSVKEPF